ncbi:MAG: hypothetical protein NC204_05790, partial [Candidatus Amulumruptor caecigallinarius]|nr:hypothetical protein [Candidatus Amulumruptor caecigallinarius]
VAELEQKKYDQTHNADGTEKNLGAELDKNKLLTKGMKQGMVNLDNAITGALDKGIAARQSQLQTLYKEMGENSAAMKSGGSSSTTSPKGGGAHHAAQSQQKTILEEIEAQIKANQDKALTASATEVDALRKETLALVAKRDKLREIQESLVVTKQPEYTPPAIAEIKTYEELDNAVQYYSDKLKKSESEGRVEINRTIKKLEELRDSWDNALNPQAKESGLDTYINGILSGSKSEFKSQKSPLAGMGFDDLKSRYDEIQSILSGVDGDITAEQRKSLKEAAAEYARYAKKSIASMQQVRGAWGNVQGIVGGITSIKDAAESQGSAWEKMSGIINGAFQVFDGIRGIISLFQLLSTVQQIQSATTVAGAAAEQGAAAAKVQAAQQVTTANMQEAGSAMIKAHAGIPFVGVALATAGIAALVALLASLPKFAEGGIAYGPTLGIFGEYAGARNNPEVVAPLDKLRSMIGGGGAERLTCEISMRKLKFHLDKRSRYMSRI